MDINEEIINGLIIPAQRPEPRPPPKPQNNAGKNIAETKQTKPTQKTTANPPKPTLSSAKKAVFIINKNRKAVNRPIFKK